MNKETPHITPTPLYDPQKVKSAKALTPLEMNGIRFGDRHTLISPARMEKLAEGKNA